MSSALVLLLIDLAALPVLYVLLRLLEHTWVSAMRRPFRPARWFVPFLFACGVFALAQFAWTVL